MGVHAYHHHNFLHIVLLDIFGHCLDVARLKSQGGCEFIHLGGWFVAHDAPVWTSGFATSDDGG